MKSLPGTGVTWCQRVSAGSSAAEQEQQLGLQWIGVLELVDEEPPEATLEMTSNLGVVPEQVARANEQVEEVERAFARLRRFVQIDTSHQFAVQQR